MKKMSEHDVEQMKYMMPYWYLATVYTKHEYGHDAAYEDACNWSAYLHERGYKNFCPIAHSHGLAKYLPYYGHDEWLNLDQPFMATAGGVIVVMMENWEESDGIAEEIQHFRNVGKSVVYFSLDGEFYYEDV